MKFHPIDKQNSENMIVLLDNYKIILNKKNNMHLGKKTKIVCTIGPKTETPEAMEKLLKAGMNVIRMNFSHGDFTEHQSKIDAYRKASAKTGMYASLLQDLSGPKFRIGDFSTPTVMLKAGEFITLTSEKLEKGDEKRVAINYPTLHEELVVGNVVLVDDGKKKFEVVENNIIVTGIDKAVVGNTAAVIRAIRPPEPYKGKGIKYKDEIVRRKVGKAAKAVGAK